MNRNCSFYREWIPKSVLADLSGEEQRELSRHLSECASCAAESEMYATTIGQMKSLGNVDVPKHFFVYPEERSFSPWGLFRLLSPAWQAGIAACILLVGTMTALVAAKVQVRGGKDGLVIAFGKMPETRTLPAPTLDTSRLEERILKIAEEQNRKESTEWVRTLRSEISQSQKTLTQNQRTILETALAGLENRMNNRVEASARALEERGDRSMTNLYQTLSRQRDRDMTAIDTRLSRIALNGEIKNNQTDAILETLLQVAELRLK